ncbi:hypothetical protein ANCCAN_26983 [Ancylostoma caninum]|uniref:Uncharacterized protein n=1 Tax=Ancylostoma caninum TaxID=29170 RepID=A0A368F573_ANCCA|nr:hypothetical protein ANCCAN_26983 [Ancylostoma caninum]
MRPTMSSGGAWTNWSPDWMGRVITWLTNNPAGLKLNEPVNTALASFFQYHIHLWKSECL